MSDQDTYEKIEAYLEGTMEGADLEAFKQDLLVNEALAEKVRLFRDMDKVLSDNVTLDFQKMIAEEGKRFLNQAPVPTKQTGEPVRQARLIRYPRMRMVAAAIAAILVSAVALWVVQSNNSLSGQQLFAQHFETHSLNSSMRSIDASSSSSFEQGIEQYKTKDFVAAAQTFETLLKTDNEDIPLNFCLGNAYLNQSSPQLEKASAIFQKIIDHGENVYVPRAQWYQALIALHKEDMEAAKKRLNELTKASGKLGTQAKDLLENL